MPSRSTESMARSDRIKQNDRLERRVVARLRRRPASFLHLIQEGLLTHGSANTMRDRLRDRLVFVGRCDPPRGPGKGRPCRLYTIRD